MFKQLMYYNLILFVLLYPNGSMLIVQFDKLTMTDQFYLCR